MKRINKLLLPFKNEGTPQLPEDEDFMLASPKSMEMTNGK